MIEMLAAGIITAFVDPLALVGYVVAGWLASRIDPTQFWPPLGAAMGGGAVAAASDLLARAIAEYPGRFYGGVFVGHIVGGAIAATIVLAWILARRRVRAGERK